MVIPLPGKAENPLHTNPSLLKWTKEPKNRVCGVLYAPSQMIHVTPPKSLQTPLPGLTKGSSVLLHCFSKNLRLCGIRALASLPFSVCVLSGSAVFDSF